MLIVFKLTELLHICSEQIICKFQLTNKAANGSFRSLFKKLIQENSVLKENWKGKWN